MNLFDQYTSFSFKFSDRNQNGPMKNAELACWEVVQSVKCFLSKHEPMSSYSQHPCKTSGACNPSVGEIKKGGSRVLLVNWSNWIGKICVQWETLSQKYGREWLRKTFLCWPRPFYACTHTNELTYTCIHSITHSHTQKNTEFSYSYTMFITGPEKL